MPLWCALLCVPPTCVARGLAFAAFLERFSWEGDLTTPLAAAKPPVCLLGGGTTQDHYVGGCQNYGPFLDPHCNSAPNSYRVPEKGS